MKWNIEDIYHRPLTDKMIKTLLACYKLQQQGKGFSSITGRVIDLTRRGMIGSYSREERDSNPERGWNYVTERGIAYLKSKGVI